jgi:hypothetical protein
MDYGVFPSTGSEPNSRTQEISMSQWSNTCPAPLRIWDRNTSNSKRDGYAKCNPEAS